MFKLIKIVSGIIAFLIIFIFNINISTPINLSAFGKTNPYLTVSNGKERAKLGSTLSFISDKNFVSQTQKNQYFLLNTFINPFSELSTPDKVYLGYYYNSLQTIQYFYSNDLMFSKLEEKINKDLEIKGKELISKDNQKVITWCNNKNDSYVALYQTLYEEKSQIILAIGDKKTIKEELNMNQNIGIPTSVCYRQEK